MYKILAVDDEEHVLKALKMQLESAKYEVVTARDGMEALEVLKKDPNIDLIVLDNMMPKMDGMRLLKFIKESNSAFRHIGVIMQTAKVQESDVYDGLIAGAVQYLKKPYTREILLAAVKSIIHDSEAIKEYAVRRMMS